MLRASSGHTQHTCPALSHFIVFWFMFAQSIVAMPSQGPHPRLRGTTGDQRAASLSSGVKASWAFMSPPRSRSSRAPFLWRLVEHVAVPVGDPRVDLGDLAPGPGPVGSVTGGLAGQFPLGPGEPGAVTALMPGVGGLLPGGKGQQVVEAHVDTNRTVGGRTGPGGWVLAQYRDQPAAYRVLGHGHRRRLRPSGSGRDQTMSSRFAVFARVSLPARNRNPLVVYSADFRDLFRDLQRGYFVRFAKKWLNAIYRCRSVCWSGTDETSPR